MAAQDLITFNLQGTHEFLWLEIDSEGGSPMIRPCESDVGALQSKAAVLVSNPSKTGKPADAKLKGPLGKFRGLFKRFAETPTTRDAVLKFANQYGPLIKTHEITRAGLSDPVVEYTEQFSTWCGAIVKMRQIVQLWEALQAGCAADLGRYIRWVNGGMQGWEVYFDSHAKFRPGESPEPPDFRTKEPIKPDSFFSDVSCHWERNDLVRPARCYLQCAVNREIENRVWPKLMPKGNGDELGLRCVPENLLGALWLQFGQAVSGDITFLVCEVCDNWFEMSYKAARPNRLFCTAPCRSKAYRERKAHARRLNREGLTNAEIAARLDCEVENVEKWVNMKK